MIWTCKSHDSRVHNYWIHYMSLCILLKLSYMMCGSVSGGMSSKMVWSPHVICKHRVISAVKTLLVFRIKLCMLEFDQKYFMKIPFERSISWFHNKMKTKKRHVSLKDEMWSQNKMQNDKIHNRNDLTGQLLSWISYSGNICVSSSNFDHMSFWGCSGDNMIGDILFHKLSSILETLASVQLKWPRNPPWYSHRLNYTTVVACNLSKWVQQVWNLTDAGRQSWVAEECQSWQKHLSSWCYGKTWVGKISEVSQLRVIFWFNSLHSFGIHGRAFNLSHLDKLFNSFSNSSQHHVNPSMLWLLFRIVGNLPTAW